MKVASGLTKQTSRLCVILCSSTCAWAMLNWHSNPCCLELINLTRSACACLSLPNHKPACHSCLESKHVLNTTVYIPSVSVVGRSELLSYFGKEKCLKFGPPSAYPLYPDWYVVWLATPERSQQCLRASHSFGNLRHLRTETKCRPKDEVCGGVCGHGIRHVSVYLYRLIMFDSGSHPERASCAMSLNRFHRHTPFQQNS